MSDDINQEQITLLEKSYTIACPRDEVHELLDSASLLNQKMGEIREHDRVMSIEKVAVMAALNLAHELIKVQSEEQSVSSDVSERLLKLSERLSLEIEQFDN